MVLSFWCTASIVHLNSLLYIIDAYRILLGPALIEPHGLNNTPLLARVSFDEFSVLHGNQNLTAQALML